jgi:predicted RNA binding protein YcfA (HicA-like mRNA interferase family)
MRQYMRTMRAPETSRQKIVSRLKAEGWQEEHGGEHDKFKHPERKGRIIVPRRRPASLHVFAWRSSPDSEAGRME